MYDASESTYMLHRTASGGHEWRSLSLGKVRNVPVESIHGTDNVEPVLVKALIAFAQRMGRATVIGRNQVESLSGKYDNVLYPAVSASSERVVGKEQNILCLSLPPTTYILLPRVEEFGRFIIGRSGMPQWGEPSAKDNRYFCVEVWGLPRVVSVVPDGFHVNEDVIPVK